MSLFKAFSQIEIVALKRNDFFSLMHQKITEMYKASDIHDVAFGTMLEATRGQKLIHLTWIDQTAETGDKLIQSVKAKPQISAFITDIAKAALKLSEILDNAPVAFTITTPNGPKDMLVRSSETAEQVTERCFAPIRNEGITKKFSPDDLTNT